jgi:hypothetical protein
MQEHTASVWKKGRFRMLIAALILTARGLVFADSVTVSWQPNSEPDLSGYKLYYGTTSRNYIFVRDVGDSTQVQVSGLTPGITYYFALTAYDINGNESGYSQEIPFTVADTHPPEITGVNCDLADRVRLTFSEPMDPATAELASNYTMSGGIVVQRVELQPDQRTVYIYTTQHANGTYTLTVNNVQDMASVPNTVAAGSQVSYTWSGNDETPPAVISAELLSNDFLVVTFSEAMEQNSALTLSNYSISPAVVIDSVSIGTSYERVYLTTAAHMPGETYTLTLNNVRDAAENPIAANTQIQYSCVSDDTLAPSLIAVQLVDPTRLRLQFSEALDPQSANDKTHYAISPPVPIHGAALQADGISVVLTTDSHSEGLYTVTVGGVGDASTPMNTISLAQLDYSYSPPDQTPPQLVQAVLTSDDLLELTFSEPMDPFTAGDVANYTISPSVDIVRTTLDVSQAIVFLHTQQHGGGTYRVTVNGLNDQAAQPNTISPGSYADYTYTPPDQTPPLLMSAVLHGADVLELVFSEALDRTSSETKGNYAISPYVDILQISLAGDSLNRVFLNTAAHTPGESYSITVANIADRAAVPNVIAVGTKIDYTYIAADQTPPVVSGFELQGDRLIILTFNESVDQTTAEDTANYTITPLVSVEEATLDASLKKVFLRTENHMPGTNYTLAVQGVLDRAVTPNAMVPQEQDYTFSAADNVPPRLIRAELHGDRTLELSFSEPLEAGSAVTLSNYQLSGGPSVVSASLSRAQTEVFLETTAHTRGDYSVTVSGVRDLANPANIIGSENQAAYTYTPVDTLPPQLLLVRLLSPSAVELIFNEPVKRSSAEDTAHYSINNGIEVLEAILDVTQTRIILQTGQHVPGNYMVTINGIQDGSPAGNLISANTIGNYSYINEDRTPPRLLGASLSNDQMLKVTFSEALDSYSALNKENYRVNNSVQVQDVFFSGSTDEVIVQTSPHGAGNYTLTVNGVKDASPAGNSIEAYSQIQYVWSPIDTVGPSLTSAILHNNNYLELIFDEALAAGEAENPANYSITPSIQVQKAVLDASLSRVWLFTAAHAPNTYTVTVSNVTDRAFDPNPVTSDNQAVYQYTPPDTSAPALLSVQMRTPMSLALVFDEPLSRASAENVGNYRITPGIEVIQAYLLASLTTVHLETSPHQAGVNYRLEIQDIMDRATNPNTLNAPLSVDYTYTPPDTTSPQLISAKLQGTNLLELIFSEPVEQVSAENRQNYRIDPMVEVLNAVLDTSNVARVYLETTNHLPGIGYGVNAENIRDRAPSPNTIRSGFWLSYSLNSSGGLADQTPPQVARVDVISSERVDVVFTEPVDSVSAQMKENYTICEGVTVQAAVLDSGAVKVYLKTSSHSCGLPYTIRVSNILDRAPTPNLLETPVPVRYILQGNMILSGLNRPEYGLRVFQPGDSTYVDRAYVIDQVPEILEGVVQIVTANEDKAGTGSAFITFELKGEATVYVGYDRRIDDPPDWLETWRLTGEQVIDSRSNVFRLYAWDAKDRRVILGGNGGTTDDNMYLVFVKPRQSSQAALANLNRAAYQLEHVNIGDRYYVDRDYTIAQLPDTLKDLLWIKTANDDKMNREEDFLTFTLNQKADVFIAYDSQIAALPRWLLDWTLEDETIVDSRGTEFDVYSKTFPQGPVTMGGNCGTSDDNMYFVMIHPHEMDDPEDKAELPGYFTLLPNYPNPFNPRTVIPFSVHKPGRVILSIFNVLGQRVRVLLDREVEAGYTDEIIWDGRDEWGQPVASGVYFYRIQQEKFALTQKMLLMR